MIDLLLFTAGLTGVIAGAEMLVRGAGQLAGRFGLSPLVIGLTVVAFGTSAPELAITLRAAFTDHAADLALGNIAGSNIANILLVLGLAALIAPVVVAQRLIHLHVPVMIGASVLTLFLARDGNLGAVDGAVLLTGLVGYLVLTLTRDRAQISAETAATPAAPLPRALAGVALGIPLLAVGAFILVDAAAALAARLGISDLVIGLTLVAVGTSLPEIAATVSAYRLGDRQMAVGNLVGSNIFNLLAVLGLAALLAPEGVAVAAAAFAFDLPVMLAVAFACLPVFFTGHTVARWEGALFLGYYAGYCAFLFLAAAQHQALGPFSAVMLGFVVPLTLITLAVGVMRQLREHRRGLYS